MKFLFSRDLRENSYLRLLLTIYLVMLLAFIGLNVGYETFRFGLTPEAIRDSILGNADLFREAVDLPSLVVDLHTHLFLYSVAFLTLFSVFARGPASESIAIVVSLVLGVLIVLDSVSVLVVRFIHPVGAWLKAASFIGIQAIFVIVTVTTLKWLWSRK